MICYSPDNNKSHLQSTKKKTDTNGWAYYIGETVDGLRTGQGTYFFNDGRAFIGEWEKNRMKKGEMSYLQPDGMRIIKKETFDVQNDRENKIDCTKQ